MPKFLKRRLRLAIVGFRRKRFRLSPEWRNWRIPARKFVIIAEVHLRGEHNENKSRRRVCGGKAAGD
ncbi:MAG: hypothetical protein ACR2QC_03105 [Gammaproteobacteria bacterium]